jgi:hypothetical protein
MGKESPKLVCLQPARDGHTSQAMPTDQNGILATPAATPHWAWSDLLVLESVGVKMTKKESEIPRPTWNWIKRGATRANPDAIRDDQK